MAGRLDELRALVADEEDARVCPDISDAACRVASRNFFVMASAQVLAQLGDKLADPKTVPVRLTGHVGAVLARSLPEA